MTPDIELSLTLSEVSRILLLKFGYDLFNCQVVQ